MNGHKTFGVFLAVLLLAATCSAQGRTSTTTGGIKGKVHDASGASVNGVVVVARQGEREVAHATTDRKGEFTLSGLAPGIYGLTFRKAGLSAGTLEGVEVRAGKMRELSDHLIMKVDEGTLAFIRGSVFNAEGRSVPGARVEIARLASDGTAKKIDGRITSETGSFVFRLLPETAKYRITVKANGAEAVSKDVEVDGAAVYRVALSISPAPK